MRDYPGEPCVPRDLDATSTARLNRVLQLASAASPVGSYAYSDGLEFAVSAGMVRDESTARTWIRGLLFHAIGAQDLPLLLRMHRAWEQERAGEALRWNAWLLACRETAELRLADLQQGQALLRVLAALDLPGAGLPHAGRVGYACAFALASTRLGIPANTAAAAFAYAWLENAIVTAIKLVPLGQYAGQRLVLDLGDDIPAICRTAARIAPGDIAAGAPGLAVASALHETQETRLYRS